MSLKVLRDVEAVEPFLQQYRFADIKPSTYAIKSTKINIRFTPNET